MSVWHGLEWNLQVVLVCSGNLVYIYAQRRADSLLFLRCLASGIPSRLLPHRPE